MDVTIGEVWLGLDVGERRIGVAKSDPFGWIAQPFQVIVRSESVDEDIARIVALAEEEGAKGIVVGLPLRTDGTRGPEAEQVQQFAEALRTQTDLPIEWVDERFTTVIANRSLQDLGIRGSARTKRVDQVAAALILQTFLDRRRHDGTR